MSTEVQANLVAALAKDRKGFFSHGWATHRPQEVVVLPIVIVMVMLGAFLPPVQHDRGAVHLHLVLIDAVERALRTTTP